MKQYLEESKYIDYGDERIMELARSLALEEKTDAEIAKNCFEWVRDNIRHSYDYRMNPVTCRASEVLRHGTGYCYAKSHLLAALLRANRIPAGLCYQRLSVEGESPPFCLHGLTAVYLEKFGWYRIDPRGNKPGVDALFCPPQEFLAFPILLSEEADLPEIWPAPHPQVVNVLETYATYDLVYDNLPDIELLAF